MMKRILVTGATGFVGQYVVKQLLQKNCNVVLAVQNPEQAKVIFGEDKVAYKYFNLEEQDQIENYFEYFQKPDTLIHLAWEGLPNYKSDFHINENLPRHTSFLRNIIQNGLKDVVVTGTCLEYGMLEGELEEDVHVEPTVPYAIAKHRLHESLNELASQYKIDVKWLRLFYMWGEGQAAGSLIPQLQKTIQEKKKTFPMSGGEQIRDFLPIEKMAALIVEFALIENVSGCFNCCSGIPVTVKEFVESYIKNKGASIELELGVYPYPDYEPMKFWGSTKKIKSIIKTNESYRTI